MSGNSGFHNLIENEKGIQEKIMGIK